MIVLVVGTRPELIKTAPVIHELLRRNSRLAIVHTGQHYAHALDEVFFRELELPEPVVNLGVGSLPAAEQLAQIISRTADVLPRLSPRFVLVQGDTNSVLGGALAAHKLGFPIAHLEAGLRSDDWTMPEEGNRVLTGRLAAVHFCPTPLQADRLRSEGVTRGVYVVGNTVVDATRQAVQRARITSQVLVRLGLEERGYALLTMHRPSNVDTPQRLAAWLDATAASGKALGLRIALPLHPRTAARLHEFGLSSRVAEPPFVATEALGYLDAQRLIDCAAVVLTDSGGVQEEACSLRVPCITLRANTERPETVQVGANVLCNEPDPRVLRAHIDRACARTRDWVNPLGDGAAARRVVDVLLDPMTRLEPSGSP